MNRNEGESHFKKSKKAKKPGHHHHRQSALKLKSAPRIEAMLILPEKNKINVSLLKHLPILALALAAAVELVAAQSPCYPIHGPNSKSCRCDDYYPPYMASLNWLYPTCDACCEALFSWDVPECMMGCNDSSGSSCGDGICNVADGENCDVCPDDCGECVCISCGDGICNVAGGENCDVCPEDCGNCVWLRTGIAHKISPTKFPTKSPTTSPTKSPTLSPTNSPTMSPTTCFEREGQSKLLADDGSFADHFGWAVALYGDTAIVGAPEDDGIGEDNADNRGSAYIFEKDGNGDWVQKAKLLPDDGAADEQFGRNVDLHGDTAIVGAPSNGSTSGYAYTFSS